ncbi:MAG: PilZ domain-containing protein [Proteobacteria bacterium]|nr:PilZ domain-containing protein [Pseudomonadota bacterium]
MLVSKNDFENVYNELVANKQPLVLSPKGKSVSFLCTPTGILDEAVTFHNSIPVDFLPEVVTSTEFTLVCKNYQLVSAALFAHGTDIRFPTHHISLLPQSRADERLVFSSQDEAEIVITHPFDGGTSLTRRLYDMSKGGLSFRARSQTKLMQPGRVFSKMTIKIKGRETSVMQGRVVYVKQIFEENSHNFYQVGVQFINNP